MGKGDASSRLVGLRGWLIVPGLFLALWIMIGASTAVDAVRGGNAPSIFLGLVYVAVALGLGYGFLARRQWLPRAFILVLAINGVWVVIASIIQWRASGLAWMVGVSVALIGYFQMSRRVKATFVR